MEFGAALQPRKLAADTKVERISAGCGRVSAAVGSERMKGRGLDYLPGGAIIRASDRLAQNEAHDMHEAAGLRAGMDCGVRLKLHGAE